MFEFKALHKLISRILRSSSTHHSSKNIDFQSFKEIYYQHTLNASDKWVNYFDVYEQHLRSYIGNQPNVLEIGVQNGGSLQILSQYFQNASIHGVDINPAVCNLSFKENIQVYNFDITDTNAVKKNLKHSSFDIIIDDGSHICSEVITTFQQLFPLLKASGVYIVEDLHTSYWESYGGTHYGGNYLGQASSIEFFKKAADLVNFYHINDDKFKNSLSDFDLYFFRWLKGISFYDSMAVIHKLKEPRKKAYERVVVGTVAPVSPIIEHAKKEGWYHPLLSYPSF